MPNLLSMIPGLAEHETHVPTDGFDQEAVADLMSHAVFDVAHSYPPGALEWLAKDRPDIFQELKKCDAKIEDAHRRQDMEEMRKATLRWQAVYLRAWEVFRGRPAAVEIQESLL